MESPDNPAHSTGSGEGQARLESSSDSPVASNGEQTGADTDQNRPAERDQPTLLDDGTGSRESIDGTTATSVTTSIEAVETLYDLWAQENDIKTNKLYVYLLTQSILVTAYVAGSGGEQVTVPVVERQVYVAALLVPSIGVISSLISFVSIGRTVAFQQTWDDKREGTLDAAPSIVEEYFDFHPGEEDEAEMPVYGSLASKRVLLAAPVLGSLMWLAALLDLVVV